jgi:3-hydroxyisobutyrate dehydrogenase-like beta-hydroxyacid dehydrogenase
MARLAFIGLGAMGSRLARRLLAAGHQVVGWNRTPDKARDLVAAGMTLAKSPRAAAEGVEAVFTMVTDDAALRAVGLGPDGVVEGLGPGVLCSTCPSPGARSPSSSVRPRSSLAAMRPRSSA